MSWATLPTATRAYAEEHLTANQLKVLKARLDGHSWRRIGLAMRIDEATARGHWGRALKRLAPFYDQIRKAAA